MKRTRKPKKNYVPEITPELINTLLPITRDAIVAFFDKSASQNPEQLKAAVVAAIAAFLSTLSNNGVYDQAYRAGIAASKSVPQAVIAANLANDKIRNPVRKINDTLRTTVSLIGRAAKSTLPGFSRAARESVANDVSAATAAFSLLPQNEETKGKGLIGGSSFSDEGINTAWLVPDDDTAYLKGGDDLDADIGDDSYLESMVSTLGNWFSSGVSKIGNFFSSINPVPRQGTDELYETRAMRNIRRINAVKARDIFERDYGTSPEWSAPLQSTDADYAAIDPNRVTKWEDGPQSTWKDAPKQNIDLSKIASKFKNTFISPEDTAQSTDADTPFLWKLGEKWDSFKNAITGGNPILTRIAIHAAPYLLYYGAPLAGKLLYSLGDATYGNLRRLFKKADFTEKEPAENTTWLGRTARAAMRGVQNVMKFNDSVLGSVSKWAKRKDVKRAAENVGKTILALAPAAAQDYLDYKQKMRIFEQQKKAARQQFMIDQQQQKDAVDAYNAGVIADNKRAIRDAQVANSNTMAKFAQEQENYEKLLAYDAKVKEKTDAFNDQVAQYRYRQKMAELTAAEAAAHSQRIMAGITGLIGVAGTAGAIFTGGTSLAAAGALTAALTAAGDLAASAHNHALNAERLEQAGRAAEAQQELSLYRKELNQATNDAIKYQKELAALEQKKLDRSEASVIKAQQAVTDAIGKVSTAQANYDAAHARVEGYKDLIEPTQEYVAPFRQAPVEGNMVAVPDEIRPDDPRLRKFYAREYIDPLPPPGMFMPTNTLNTIQNVLPGLLAEKPKKPKTVVPYVNPMPLEHVDAAQGRASTLRTTVTPMYRAPKQYTLQPSARNSANTSMYIRPQLKRRRL